MMERTISGMMGKGSVNHNTRAFTAKNVDKERSKDNVEFCHSDIKKVYHKLFDEALKRYNVKQKRKDRKIDDYYEKIRQGKQEKLFHEVIFQIGNKDDMNAKSRMGELAKDILTEFMEDFQRRNPNLFVFSAHLHMDEETPHLHIDFVPFLHNSKRGLDTRVSLKGALAEQGFKGGTRGATEWNQWIESEKKELAVVMERHGVKWLQKGTHNRHLSVLDFEKQERAKEVAELDKRIEKSEVALHEVEQSNTRLYEANHLLQAENKNLSAEKGKLQSDYKELEIEQQKLQEELDSMAAYNIRIANDARVYDEDRQWQLPEPGAFTSAKSYRDNSAKPLVEKLKDLVKRLTARCVSLIREVRNLTEKVNQHTSDIEWYKEKLWEKKGVIEKLQEKADDLERVKCYAGAENVQGIIDSMKEMERRDREQKKLQRNYDRGMSR